MVYGRVIFPINSDMTMTEDERLDEQTAGAFGIASFHLTQAILAGLVEKGVFSMAEVARIVGAAAAEADAAVPTSPVPEMQALAQRGLAAAARKWERQARGN